jgi:hypothetical protein
MASYAPSKQPRAKLLNRPEEQQYEGARGPSTAAPGSPAALAQGYPLAYGEQPPSAAAQDYSSWWDASDPRGSFGRLTQGKPVGSDTVRSLDPYLRAIGGSVSPSNAEGATTKVNIPGVGWTRVWTGADEWQEPQKYWDWVPQPTGFDPNRQGSGGQVFNDPATQEWEGKLRGVVDKLEQPRNNPDVNPLKDYLRGYMQKLQGPAFTDQEMDLWQTQAIDPLERQKQAEQKRVIERASARGLGGNSGVILDEQNRVDREFREEGSKRQGQIAMTAMGQQRQNAQQAAQVGQMLAGLTEGQAAGDESRMLQALGLFGQIPQQADRRLQLANQTLEPLNPTALLSMQPGFQQMGMQQQQQQQSFWSDMARLAMEAWGLG